MISSSFGAVWVTCAAAPVFFASARPDESVAAVVCPCAAAKLCNCEHNPPASAPDRIIRTKSRVRMLILRAKPPMRLRMARKHAPCHRTREFYRLPLRAHSLKNLVPTHGKSTPHPLLFRHLSQPPVPFVPI